MTKKEVAVIIGCVILFCILLALLFCEVQAPEGGAALLGSIRNRIFG